MQQLAPLIFLKSLALCQFVRITGESTIHPSALVGLKDLNLCGCNGLTDVDTEYLKSVLESRSLTVSRLRWRKFSS